MKRKAQKKGRGTKGEYKKRNDGKKDDMRKI